eukprot:scaffold105855_cov80-Phaeocystis_antarctica.AAC.2
MPRLVRRSMFAPCVSSSLIISTLPLVAAACSRVMAEARPSAVGEEQSESTSPALRSHLTKPCRSSFIADA